MCVCVCIVIQEKNHKRKGYTYTESSNNCITSRVQIERVKPNKKVLYRFAMFAIINPVINDYFQTSCIHIFILFSYDILNLSCNYTYTHCIYYIIPCIKNAKCAVCYVWHIYIYLRINPKRNHLHNAYCLSCTQHVRLIFIRRMRKKTLQKITV